MMNQKKKKKEKEERKRKQKKGRGRRKMKEIMAVEMVVALVSALVVGLVVKESQSIRVENRRSRGTWKRKTLNSIEEVESIDL